MLHLLRKKTFIKLITISPLVGGLLLFSFGASAQMGKVELNMYDHDSKPYYFGITVGVNLARFQTDLHPRFLDYDSVFVAEPVNSGGLIERNIYYKLKHPDLDGLTDVTKKVESVIMSFPFQVKFQSDRIGNFRVYTLAGFKADIDMASNARAKRAEELVKIQKYDFGPEFGIGFNFFFPSFIFSPEIKISNGIRNIHARDENLRFSNVFDKIQSRMIVFSIHLEG